MDMERTSRDHVGNWRRNLDTQEARNANKETDDALKSAVISRAVTIQVALNTHSDRSTDQERAETLALAKHHVEQGGNLAAEDNERQNDNGREQVGIVSEVERATDDSQTPFDDNGVHSRRHRRGDTE